jgi:hypothetical protein
VVALGADGRRVGRFPLETKDFTDEVATLHAAHLMGDGRTGLVVLFRERLCSFRDGIEKPVWTRQLPSKESKVLDVRPANAHGPATIVVQSGDAVFGIAGPTGKPRWRCDGPGPVVGLLSDGGDGRPAALAFALNTTTVCREALPTDEEGRYLLPEAGPVEGLTPIPSPWLSRPLPWVREARFWWDAFAVLFVVELAFLWWRRWRRTAVALAVLALLFGVGLSAEMLRLDARLKHPEQHYVWTDWYGVLAMAAAVAGGLVGSQLAFVGIVLGAVRTLKVARRRLKRRRSRARRQSPEWTSRAGTR